MTQPSILCASDRLCAHRCPSAWWMLCARVSRGPRSTSAAPETCSRAQTPARGGRHCLSRTPTPTRGGRHCLSRTQQTTRGGRQHHSRTQKTTGGCRRFWGDECGSPAVRCTHCSSGCEGSDARCARSRGCSTLIPPSSARLLLYAPGSSHFSLAHFDPAHFSSACLAVHLCSTRLSSGRDYSSLARVAPPRAALPVSARSRAVG